MSILAFDTCFTHCSVAVETEEGVVQRAEAMERGHAERLTAMIGEAMADVGLAFDRLDRIAVTHGPGSFTGVRVGVAAARALALATGARIVAIDSLEAIVERARWTLALDAAAHCGACDIAVAMKAGLDRAFFRLSPWQGPARVETSLLAVADAARRLGERPVLMLGTAAPALAEAARARGASPALVIERFDPEAVYLPDLARTRTSVDGPLEPLYLREPDAKPAAAMPGLLA